MPASSTLVRRVAGLCLLGALVPALRAQQQAVPTTGKVFWAGFMDNHSYFTPPPALGLHIASAVSTSGTVQVPGSGLTIPFTVVPGVTTLVPLPADLMHATSEVVEQKGVLVTAADTVSVYASNMLRYSTDVALVHPVQLLGTAYTVLSFSGSPEEPSLPPTHAVSELLVVATEDGTQVEIDPSSATEGGQALGVPWTVTLDRGETYQVRCRDIPTDLTGTVLRGVGPDADCHPFAVFSGTVCANVPIANCGPCDHLYEQDLPTVYWGSTYHAVPFMGMQGGFALRIVALENNTQVDVMDVTSFFLDAGESMQLSGMMDPLCIVATRPFGVAQFMQGINCSTNGDPSMVILNAVEQRITRATISTIISDVSVDPVTMHFVNVVIPTTGTGTFLLDGAPVPATAFMPFTESPGMSFAQLSITAGDHVLESPAGFSAYVYGLGQNEAESYAYSAGASFPDLGGAVLPELTTTANNGPDAHACPGSPVRLNVSPDPPGNYAYTWTPGAAVDDPAVDDPTTTADTTTWFHVVVEPINGCGSVHDSVLVTVSFSGRPPLGDTAFCQGDAVWLDAADGADGYLWSTGDTTRTIQVDTAGDFTVQLSDTAGCTWMDTVRVTVNALPVVDLGPDTALCVGLAVILDARHPGPTYRWSTGAGTRAIAVNAEATTTYTVAVTDEAACTGQDTVLVERYPLPVPTLPALLGACLAEPPYHIPLDAGNSDCSFLWSTGDPDQVHLVRNYGRFTVRIATPHDCVLEEATVVLEDCTDAIYLPNSFTPNADGMNDTFMPIGTDVATVQLSVFDRWGELIHDGEQAAAAWDGTYKGLPVKSEVYTWRLRYRFYDSPLHLGMATERERYGTVLVLR